MKFGTLILFLKSVVRSKRVSSREAQKSFDFLNSADAKIGDLQLEECSYKIDQQDYPAECGTLIVPENWADPESRLIALPVTRIRSTQTNPAEPIFFLNGGPGSSNMDAKHLPAVLEKHDFVMVGYRGVDGSVVLDCPEVNQALIGDGVDVLSDASLKGISTAMRKSAVRLQAKGIDLDCYTPLEVIDDMEAARKALGYGQINLISLSYGTRVAQYYAHLYPDSIHRSIMVSVNPPGRFVWEPEMVDAQIEYYSRLYAQTEDPRTPDLAQTMLKVSQNMPERWLFFKIDPGKAKLLSFALLYHLGTAAQVFDVWLSAAEGDPSGLALMTLLYDIFIPGSNVSGEQYCKGVSADYDPTRDYTAEMDPPNSIIGSPMSKLLWGSATDADGATWPTALLPEEFHQVQPSEVETLLVSGNIDFSTPVEYARDELLPALKNGKQVILSEMGHVSDVMTLQPEAIARLLTHFYETGEVDDSLFVYQPMDFKVSFGYPKLAKISMAVVAGLVTLIGLAIMAVIF